MGSLFDIDLLIVQELCSSLDIDSEFGTCWIIIEIYTGKREFGVHTFHTLARFEEEKAKLVTDDKTKFLFAVSPTLFVHDENLVSFDSDVWKMFSSVSEKACDAGNSPDFTLVNLDKFKTTKLLSDGGQWQAIIGKCNLCEMYSIYGGGEHCISNFCRQEYCGGFCEKNENIDKDIPFENKIKLEKLWQIKEQMAHREYVKNQFSILTELLDRPGMPGACASWLEIMKNIS